MAWVAIGRNIGFQQRFKGWRIWGLGICWALAIGCGWLWAASPVQAAPVDRPALTLESLRDRLEHPQLLDGKPAIDLSQSAIDLRSDNGSFREAFYQQVASKLQQERLGLDLRGSSIQGDLDLARLGLRAPLYGKALSPLLTPTEQEQLGRDRLRLLHLSRLSRSLLLDEGSPLDWQISVFRGPIVLEGLQISGSLRLANTYFLEPVEARGLSLGGALVGSLSRFSQGARFSGLVTQSAQFRNSLFTGEARFDGAKFAGNASFQSSTFERGANFYRSQFQAIANFSKSHWNGSADLTQADWQGEVRFDGASFASSFYAIDSLFHGESSFRNARFAKPLNLRGATILDEADFTSASFAPGAYINVSGLDFDSDQAKLIGSPGEIGRILSVPVLQGNETVLRTLVRNFRRVEQIADANQVDYTLFKLRLKTLQQRLTGVNLNAAKPAVLVSIGFSPTQAQAIAQARDRQPLRTVAEMLSIEGVDLATYVKVRDRVTADRTSTPLSWGTIALQWLGTNLLILLSRAGTSAGLVLGVGLVAMTFFALWFWLVDRLRKLRPQPIVPTWPETLWMGSSAGLLFSLGLATIFQTSDRPWWTLASVAISIGPIPIALLIKLYWRGRFHDLMDVSYFVENGEIRQVQLPIARLPLMPRYHFFRERFMPLLWNRRWAWLNYYDLSAINLFRIGFSDVRMRDEHLPAEISLVVWYQWTLGLMYIGLLLWTLSRTIPGLNLLIYFG